uniref:Uncharacterized protein n=1 Tax=Zea mays TaxID=4577 RepID=A0A804PMC3_MAIZE
MDVDSRMATESGSDACDGSGSGSETPTVSPSPSAFRSSSWFYLRVGCDQSHEQVDPEALDRSFLMRVMAARSPNVRLQKAIDRKNQSSMLKCSHSAPPKRPRARFVRLSAETEAAGKAPAEPKPRVERICAM